LQNDNQVINFINNQYMTWLQQRGWQNCHAAALVKDGFAYAVAGFSGGGKSTLMLQMLENEQTCFLSNDRLFIQPEDGQLKAIGVPKMPRINPGTIINNPRLENMMTPAERESLLALSPQALWDLEQKYDVDVEAVYGPGRIVNEAPLKSFLVLNWQRESDQPLQLIKINLRERPDLLSAIMKAPGPFYQKSDGLFSIDTYHFDQEAYLNALVLVDIYEATGRVDFSTLAEHYLAQKEI
jgi:HprK-related kinase B